MKEIIIVGKSGSGKTTLLNQLQKLGFIVLFCDDIVNELYQKDNKGYDVINNVFGSKYINDKEVDKKKLSKSLNNNEFNIKDINDNIHPLVVEEIAKIKFDFLECSGFKDFSKYENIIELDVEDNVAIERLINYRNIKKEHAKFLVGLYNKPNNVKFTIDSTNWLDEKTIDKIINIK